MKRYLIMAFLLAGCLASAKAELSDEQIKLQKELSSRVRIGTVNNNTIRTGDNEKIEVFKFRTNQDERSKLNYRARVTVELTDKSEQVCFAQFAREQGPVPIGDYTGEDDWEFQIPHGSMERPKITAYAIQYGVLDEGVFVPIVEKLSKIDNVEEIAKRTASRIDFGKTLHSYQYRDAEGEVVTSTPN